jgi:hypothetical protein
MNLTLSADGKRTETNNARTREVAPAPHSHLGHFRLGKAPDLVTSRPSRPQIANIRLASRLPRPDRIHSARESIRDVRASDASMRPRVRNLSGWSLSSDHDMPRRRWGNLLSSPV